MIASFTDKKNFKYKTERIKWFSPTMYEPKAAAQGLHMPCESGTSGDQRYPAMPWNPPVEPEKPE